MFIKETLSSEMVGDGFFFCRRGYFDGFYASLTILRSFYTYQVTANNNWNQNSNFDFLFDLSNLFSSIGFSRDKKKREPYYRQQLEKRFGSWGSIRKFRGRNDTYKMVFLRKLTWL